MTSHPDIKPTPPADGYWCMEQLLDPSYFFRPPPDPKVKGSSGVQLEVCGSDGKPTQWFLTVDDYKRIVGKLPTSASWRVLARW